MTLLDVAAGSAPTAEHVARLLAEEAIGGALLGLVLGLITYQLLKRVDEYQTEILLTIALVSGGVCARRGLSHIRPDRRRSRRALNRKPWAGCSRCRLGLGEHLDVFWEVVDGILNVVLFVLIGLEVLIIPFSLRNIAAALIAIPLTLVARWLS